MHLEVVELGEGWARLVVPEGGDGHVAAQILTPTIRAHLEESR